jgi:pimeloyl-ACP methyl ester carboxylesterase
MKAVHALRFGVDKMVQRNVHIECNIAAFADAVWAIVREFCGRWHPAITSMEAAQGGSIRRFTLKEKDTICAEQLTYFSDTDRTYSYKLLEGIRDVESYEASFTVTALDGANCKITWRAIFAAPEPRATAIAEGTGNLFQMGIDELRTLVPRASVLGDIALDVAGRPSDTLCLFLHGIGGGRINWSRQLPIAAQFMQSAAMDLRGYGDSKLGDEPSIVDDYCNDILRVMEQRRAQKLVLVGLSYGSWLATSFAMRHPEKLLGLVLAGGCTGMSEASVEECNRFRAARETPLNEGKTPKDFAAAVVNVIASTNASEKIRQELFNSMAAIPAPTYLDALQCFTQPTEKFDFSKITMPVLFITGEHDKLATPAEIRAVSQRVHSAAQNPNVQFEILAGAGHVCNVEVPQAFNVLLSTFLKNRTS